MSKIKHISIQNFKAISAIDLDLNGCSAIIVGKNESGKSTLLKGLSLTIEVLTNINYSSQWFNSTRCHNKLT